MDYLGEQRLQCDTDRGDLDTRQMRAQPTCTHEKKDMLGGQLPGESSHNFSGKSAHLDASLKFPAFSNPSSETSGNVWRKGDALSEAESG